MRHMDSTGIAYCSVSLILMIYYRCFTQTHINHTPTNARNSIVLTLNQVCVSGSSLLDKPCIKIVVKEEIKVIIFNNQVKCYEQV
jgi:hypothetical protein